MNAPHPIQHQLQPPLHTPVSSQSGNNAYLLEYWDILVDNRWLVGVATAISIAVGGIYLLLAKPVFEANLLIQVEDSAGSAKSFLGEAASLFDVKTPASAEIEILRSRMVIGQAVDNTLLFIEARPHQVPVIGGWLSRKATGLSTPFSGWVSGTEKIVVAAFTVPAAFEGSRFRITATGNGRYTLSHPDLTTAISGQVGAPLTASVRDGTISLTISHLEGKAGAEFNVTRHSRLETVEDLQKRLSLAEKGRQSGVIDATLSGSDRDRLTLILNEIGAQYVRQNVDRKAAEAQKTLQFLDVQLPQFKKQLDRSEEVYNRYRNQHGTVALDEEAKLILARNVDLQTKLVEAQQKRREFMSRFTEEHPTVQTLDAQIKAWEREIGSLNSRVRDLPSVQQDALRLERDVKVNNELYQQLRNNALQLQLIREGKIGNVRLIDSAVLPEESVKPRAGVTVALSLVFGLFAGVLLAIARNTFFRGVASAQEIEASTGLNVYNTIPLSEAEGILAKRVTSKQSGVHVLATTFPRDPAVESLRSLRTALQFAMLEADNNRLLISGPTPGVGKSFVSANLAAVIASAGKRVLLIDADLRKGHLNQYFGLERANGLSELIAGIIPPGKAIHRAVVPHLDVLTTGVLPPNPADLVVSHSFSAFLAAVSTEYDLVLIDSAPVLVAADTVSISSHAGTVLLVARADQTQIGELNESTRRLLHAGTKVTGVLFNAVDISRRHYGSYGYKYGGYRYQQYAYEPVSTDAGR